MQDYYCVFYHVIHHLQFAFCNPQINKLMVVSTVVIIIDVAAELFIPLLDCFLPGRTCHIYEDFTVRNHDGIYGAFDGFVECAAIVLAVQ